MFRLYAGVYGVLFDLLCKFFVAHVIQHGTRNRLVCTLDDAKFHSDRCRCIFVVTGDHDRSDAGLTALLDRIFYFRSYRVDHTGKSQVDQILLQYFRRKIGRFRIPNTFRTAEHTECTVCHRFVAV